jgi:hypothetical protein
MARHFRIHPGIGVARMGNSSNHFVGPETPGVPANSDDGVTFKSFRDNGQILRQGARFRVFEYDEAEGNLNNPREVNIGKDIVNIEWRVHLANRKASFYTFYGQFGADDNFVARSGLPATQQIKVPNDSPLRQNLRNADIPSADRTSRLEIDPGEQMISKLQPGPIELSNAKVNIPIKSLGTLLLDTAGRLIVLGGYGESNTTENPVPPDSISEYANNDNWFDDASDGSIKARVFLSDGTFVDADPAWVLVGPPNFAPGIGNVVTLFDTLWDIAVREITLPAAVPTTPMMSLLLEQKKSWQANGATSLAGFKPSFIRDIYPLLKRALNARNVHVSSIGKQHYHETLFRDWGALAAPEGKLLRNGFFAWIRDPDDTRVKWDKMPRGLGDDYTLLYAEPPTPPQPSPRSFLSLTRIQYALLREWATDNFINDWPGKEPVFTPNANPTPDDLDKAAALNSVGGPFYPGIDVSWLIRVKELYAEALRLKIAPGPESENNSPILKIGALTFQPGFFSQQMALPWQADFYDCHKEQWEDPSRNYYYFMWWTAHRPDDVFPTGGNTQLRWVREFDKAATTADPDDENNLERFIQMQSKWSQLKFVSIKNGDHYEEEP